MQNKTIDEHTYGEEQSVNENIACCLTQNAVESLALMDTSHLACGMRMKSKINKGQKECSKTTLKEKYQARMTGK